MVLRYFALIYGIVFLLVGIAGFIPALLAPPTPASPDVAVTTSYGHLFGLFPVNVLHNLVHAGFGVWGLFAFASVASSLLYARAVAVIYAVFMILGFLPILNTLFGLVPLYGHDIWLHALLAGVAGYFGFIYHAEDVPATHSAAHRSAATDSGLTGSSTASTDPATREMDRPTGAPGTSIPPGTDPRTQSPGTAGRDTRGPRPGEPHDRGPGATGAGKLGTGDPER
jgi:hypothetical protein